MGRKLDSAISAACVKSATKNYIHLSNLQPVLDAAVEEAMEREGDVAEPDYAKLKRDMRNAHIILKRTLKEAKRDKVSAVEDIIERVAGGKAPDAQRQAILAYSHSNQDAYSFEDAIKLAIKNTRKWAE